MNNNFNIDQVTKSEILNPNSIKRPYKLKIMCNFMEINSNDLRWTQKQISKQLRYSDSTIKRYRDDINMNSPFNRNIYKKRSHKQIDILKRLKIQNLLQKRDLEC